MSKPIDNFSRLPPHSPEAEQGVLGCILLSPNDCIGDCISTLRAGSESFYDLRHRSIYDVLVGMYDRREEIDILTIQERLRSESKLEQIGGIPYLCSLQDQVPSAANLPAYLEIVRDKFVLRRMLKQSVELTARIYDMNGSSVEEVLDEAERSILAVSQLREGDSEKSTQAIVDEAMRRIDSFLSRNGVVSGLQTGYPDLDNLTNGLQPGEMTVVAGRPSTGKTSLAMNIVEDIAVTRNIPTGVFSLEMTAQALITRMISSRSGIPWRTVRDGYASDKDVKALSMAGRDIRKAPMFIDDAGGLSVLQIRTRARRMFQKNNIKLVVVDYLQLVSSTNQRAQNRDQEVGDVSMGLKNLAKELNIPVLVLCQLNRSLERDKARRPRMSDLRESGRIEQDADVIGILYHDEDVNLSDSSVPTNLAVVKQRNGPVDDVPFTFLKSTTRFESAAKVSDEDVPEELGNYRGEPGGESGGNPSLGNKSESQPPSIADRDLSTETENEPVLV